MQKNMRLVGQGRTAQVYEYDENKAVKLFFEGKDADGQKEYSNLRIVNRLGIPAPKVYDTVLLNGCYGIVEEKLSGIDGLTLLTQGGDARAFLKQMTKLQKQLNEKQSTECMPYKEFLKGCLWRLPESPKKEAIVSKIEALPDGDCLCHGDFHPGNVFVKENGEAIIIDFVNLCRAPKEFDIARSYFLMAMGELPPELSEEEKQELDHARNALASLYLDEMRTPKSEIEPYLEVIDVVRTYEI